MRSSYLDEDVTILLKDITGQVEPLPATIREKRIQSGTHYCEMLPLEYVPSSAYLKTYEQALELYAQITADAVARLGDAIWAEKNGKPVLVSLARAGTPIGILLRRYIRKKYGFDVPHYTISIIRGRGIDKNAMDYILERHDPSSIQFVDGWTGKGAIQRQLIEAMTDYPEVSAGLAVLSDAAWTAEKCGTHDDFLIASSCLNATVSGLISRTFLSSDLIGPEDFHGAMYYGELKDEDRTYEFIHTIESHLRYDLQPEEDRKTELTGLEEVHSICEHFSISDINLVKPGIGEATRVLLRRIPERILGRSLDDFDHLGHLYQLAMEKDVPVEVYPLKNYRACGIIRSIGDC